MKLKYDVIVAGGGTAGVAAALSAARCGVSVLLIEKNSYVGGTAASGLPFIDFFTKRGEQIAAGVGQELMTRLKDEQVALDHIHTQGGHLNSVTMIDPEWVKLVAEEMLIESGCNILYHSIVCSAKVEDGCLKSITVANKNGLFEYEAGCFVDTTGDADLAVFAGVETETGREEDGLCQAMSLLFRLGDVDVKRATDMFHENPINAQPVGGTEVYNLHISGKLTEWNDIIREQDIFPHDDHNIWAGTMRENELTYVNTVRVSGKNGSDVCELTEAEIEGRRQLKKIMKFLNKYVPGMEKAYISSMQNGIGIRETRRIVGAYVLNRDDVIQGRKFETVIAKSGYCIDIHDPKGTKWGVSYIESDDKCYDIPYECIVPEKVDNLLVAGRCISATAEALGSTRIMPTCMALGQAAGVAAAISVKEALHPRSINVSKLQTILKDQKAII